jgi:hypothetical protein
MHKGIFGSAMFKVVWQDLKMRKFVAKWTPHWNEAQQWSCYEVFHNRFEQCCCEGDMLNWINAVSEMWVRAVEWELQNKALNVIHVYYENESYGKINHPQSSWSFYMLLCVIPVPVCYASVGEVSRTGWKSRHAIMLQATQQTLLRMFSGNAGRKWYDILRSPDFIPFVCELILKLEQPLLWKTVCKWRCYKSSCT